jgi:hypothetical protein
LKRYIDGNKAVHGLVRNSAGALATLDALNARTGLNE